MNFMIGSTNQGKSTSSKRGIGSLFSNSYITSVEMDSGVSNQPFGDEETRYGAINRALEREDYKKVLLGLV